MDEHWRHVRVFISSTFKDTRSERDLLTRKIFPRLRQWASTRFIDVVEIDLRWGVTEHESASGKATQLCLREIDRCNVFLGLLGSRYGWTPDSYDVPTEPEFDWVHKYPRARSITEVEMARACLNPREARSATISESLFYVRDPTFLEDVPAAIKPIFCDGEVQRVAGVTVFQQDEAKKTSLQALIERIKEVSVDRPDIRMESEGYACTYDGERTAAANPGEAFVLGIEPFGEQVFTALQRTITRIFPPSMTVYKPLVLQRIRHVLYAKKNAENVRGRAELCASLVAQLMEHGSHHAPGRAIVLSGRPGIGKTAVMSDVIGQLTERLQKEFDSSPAGVSLRKKLDESRKKRQAQQRKKEKKRRKESALESKTKGASGVGTNAGSSGLPNAGIRVGEREPRTVVPGRALIAHLVGSTTRSDDVRLLLTRLVLELREVLVQTAVLKSASNSRTPKAVQSLPPSMLAESPEATWLAGTDPAPVTLLDLKTLFLKALPIVCSKTRVIIVLDDMDATSTGSTPLSWLPELSPPPAGLTLLVSANIVTESNPGDVALDALVRRGATEVVVPALTAPEAEACVAERLGVYGKKLDGPQMEEFMKRHDANIPLYIQVAVEELRIFGIYEQVLQRIRALPESMPELFDQALERLEEDHGVDILQDFVCLLYCSPQGLTEEELVAMLHITQQQFGMLRTSFIPYINEQEVAGSQPRLQLTTSSVLNNAIFQRYLSTASAPLPTPLPTPKPTGGLPTSASGARAAAVTVGQLRRAEEVYHTNLALFFAGRAFGWGLRAAASEVMLGEARASPAQGDGELHGGSQLAMSDVGWSLPTSPEQAGTGGPHPTFPFPEGSPPPTTGTVGDPPTGALRTQGSSPPGGRARSVEFTLTPGQNDTLRASQSPGPKRSPNTRTMSRVGPIGKNKRDAFVPGRGGTLSYLQFRQHRDIKLPIVARNKDVDHVGDPITADVPPIAPEAGAPDVAVLLATLLDDEEARRPPKKPPAPVKTDEEEAKEGKQADAGKGDKPSTKGAKPKGGGKKEEEKKAEAPPPPVEEFKPKPPSEAAVKARHALLVRAGLAPDPTLGPGVRTPRSAAVADTAHLGVEGSATLRRRGKWCFGSSGALTAMRLVAYHLWRSDRLKESVNVLCDISYVEAMHAIGAANDLIDLLHSVKASAVEACKTMIPASLVAGSAQHTPLRSPRDPTLGLSAAQRAALQRLERVSAMLAFLQANVNDISRRPALTFQFAVNQPDSNIITRDASTAWDLNWENRHYLQWLNKAEKQDPCLMTMSLAVERASGRAGATPGAPGTPRGNASVSSRDDAGNDGADNNLSTMVTRTAFNSDGTLVASGHASGGICVWDIVIGRLRKELTPPPPDVAAPPSIDMEMLQRKLKRKSTLQSLRMPALPRATALTFNPRDDRWVLSGNSLGQLFLWDVRLGACKEITHPTPTLDAARVAVQEECARQATVAADLDRDISDVSDVKLRYEAPQSAHLAAVTVVAWSQDGRRILSGDELGMIISWRVESDDVLVLTSEAQPVATHRWVAHTGPVTAITFADELGWDPPSEPMSVSQRFASLNIGGTAITGATDYSSPFSVHDVNGLGSPYGSPKSPTNHNIPINPMGSGGLLSLGVSATLGVTQRTGASLGGATVMGAHSNAIFPFSSTLDMGTATVRAPPSINAGSVATPPPKTFKTHAFSELSKGQHITAFTPPGTHSSSRLRRNMSRHYQSQKVLGRIQRQLAPLRKRQASASTGNLASYGEAARHGHRPSPVSLARGAGSMRRQRLARQRDSERKGGGGEGEESPTLQRVGRAPGEVLGLKVLADGLQAVVRRTNGRVQLVSTTGDHVELQEASGPEITSCAFSCQDRVVARFVDRSIRVYRSDNGERVGVLKGHKKKISDVVYSPKGHMVASGSEDGTLRLWRPGLLSSKTAGAVHHNAVVFMHMSHFSNGLQLISVDTGGVVKHWRVDTAVPFATTYSSGKRLVCADFVQREQRVQAFVAAETQVRVWDCPSNAAGAPTVRTYSAGGPISHAAMAPRGYRIALARGDSDPCVQIVDTVSKLAVTKVFTSLRESSTGKRRKQKSNQQSKADAPQADKAAVVAMAWSPDSRLLLTALAIGDIIVWDGAERAFGAPVRRQHKSGQDPAQPTPSSGAGAGAGAGSAAGGKRGSKVSGRGGSRPGSRGPSRGPSRAGSVAAGTHDGASAAPGGEESTPAKPDELDAALSAPWVEEEQFVATLTDMLVTSPGQRKVKRMEFSPDGTTLLVHTKSRVAKLWDFAGAVNAFQTGNIDALRVGSFTRQCFGHSDEVLDAAFSPCGRNLVTASNDGTLRMWESPTVFQTAKYAPHGGKPITMVRWGVNNNRLCTFGKDNTISILDPSNGVQLASWIMHTVVTSLAVSPACDRVAVGDETGSVRLLRLRLPDGEADPPAVGTIVKVFSAEKHIWDEKFTIRCTYCANQTVVKKRIQDMVANMSAQIAVLGPGDRYFTDHRMDYKCAACLAPTKINPYSFNNPAQL